MTASPQVEFGLDMLTLAGEIMGLSPANMRVSAARLCTEGKITRTARGSYTLRTEALPAYTEVSSWRTRIERMVAWEGTWNAVDHSRVKRSDRAILRAHHTALSLAGMAHWTPAVALRPNNLDHGTHGLRVTLSRLGAAAECHVYRIDEMSTGDVEAVPRLWDTAARTRRLQEASRALTDAARTRDNYTAVENARTSLLLGSAVISTIVHDPLLPEELAPVTPLVELIEQMKDFQDHALTLWLQLLHDGRRT
ncbi:hypothetical protein [Nocardia africana]|uniref:hypothetical protein n=1 Tax=Nocardia africana TaxID=134964 RepID=UPI001D138543|nr:hypothetical protein [Nocardia africana]MCC3312942.1 hypothetical protein [Nocardia africana]